MPFEVTILGSSSAIPVYGRNHTAQYLKIQNHNFLVDCGEGTQLQLSRYGLKMHKLDAIFISHLHGDHYLGLIGVLSSLHLTGRKRDLHLFGPPPLSEIITTQLKYSDTSFRYHLHFHPLQMEEEKVIYENNKITVSTLPVEHRIPCVGFLFKEKEHPRRINKLKLPASVSLQEIAMLKKGQDISNTDGSLKYAVKNLTNPPKKSRSYAYVTDTSYLPELGKSIQNVDLLYHEATFLTEKELQASKTFHSTAGQAATMAKKSAVGQLIIGHFSARYKDITPLETEARTIFANSFLALEGKTFSIEY